MGKPSMFSKDYEKNMKKRRIRNTVLSIICVLVVIGIGAFFFMGNNSQSYLANLLKREDDAPKENIKEETKETTKQDDKVEAAKEETKEVEETKSSEESNLLTELNIGNGKVVKANFEEQNGEKIFKGIDTNGNKVSFDIDAKGKYVVLLDEDSQNLYISDTNGTLTDVSLTTYTSTGGTQFNKDSILKENPSYVWHKSPKFLNDNTLVYVSQLPWFNKEDKYIWIEDLNNKNHQCLNVQGKEITFGNMSDKGLEVNIDGTLKYITADGKMTN